MLGPLIAGLFHSLPGGGDVEQRFLAMSACAGLAHAACAVALLRWVEFELGLGFELAVALLRWMGFELGLGSLLGLR